MSVTNSVRENLVDRGVDRNKIHVVTNGVDAGRFSPMEKDPQLVAELGLEGKFVAGYIGTHGMAHALETILRCADRFERGGGNGNVQFLLLGSGARKEALMELSTGLGLSNVTFLDTVPKLEVARYWSLLDVSIIHLRKTPLFKTVIPSKMFESMGMGIPILLGVQGESAEILDRTGAGVAIEPENDKAMFDALNRLQADSDLFEMLSKKGVVSAALYDRSKLAQQMLEIMRGVLIEGTKKVIS